MSPPGICRGFPPLAQTGARVLVLGSMPGIASLRAGRYYNHPRNAFWPIMGHLVGAGPELDYPIRIRRLCDAGIAVWDVLAGCRRSGSLDRAILQDSIEGNDFSGFLGTHPALCTLFFNGSEADRLFRRHVLPELPPALIDRLACYRLPSTSPAHAGRSFDEKLDAWKAVREALHPREEPR